MKNATFWTFAARMLRRKKFAVGTIVFSVLSAGGLAAGLVAIGPLLKLILSGEGGANLRTIADGWISAKPWLADIVGTGFLEYIPTDRFSGVALILGGLCILAILGGLANFAHQYCSLTLSMLTVAEIRLEVFRHALRLPLGLVVRRGPADIVTRIVRDTAELERGFSALTSKALAQLTKGLAAFGAAIWFDWRLTIVAVIVAPVLATVLRKFGKRISRGSGRTMRAYEHMLRNSNEALQGLRGVKTASAERTARRRFARANKDVVMQDRAVRIARAISSPLIEVLAILVVSALALLAAHEIIAGRMQFDRFLLALASIGFAADALRPLTSLFNDIQAATAPAQRISEILSIPAEGMRERDLPALPRHGSTPGGSIEFDRVRFRYEGADRDAVRDFSLAIRHGEFIALVGPNGCGKTTLASMLVRLFDPADGAIRIDGIDVQAASLSSLRAQIGVVAQDPLLIRGTIRQNVTLGCEGASDAEIERAMRMAHAWNFVSALPAGLAHELGEGGSGLSGGQRQRLAIARALVRDPSVLVLDEATSQIDAESEAQIAAAIDEFRTGRTVIAIAHRLSTVRTADRIVVMDEGRLLDVGTHAELLGRCDLYQRLVHTQLVG
jgi:ABC-type multidrug transport system fused ATPase/permease subunit